MFFFPFEIVAIFLLFLKLIFLPSDFSKLNIVSISLTRGRFLIVTFLSKSKVAASIGRAAFLLPEIDTSPLILEGPLILNLSILNFGKRYPFLAHIFSISVGI